MSKKKDRAPVFCRLCDEETTESQLCEGCGYHICKACDQIQTLPWEHEPEAHKDSL